MYYANCLNTKTVESRSYNLYPNKLGSITNSCCLKHQAAATTHNNTLLPTVKTIAYKMPSLGRNFPTLGI